MDTSLEIHGLDLALTGFIDPSSGIAGVLDFTGTLASDGQQMNTKGKVTAAKLKLVPGGSPAGQPVEVDYDAAYALKPQTGSLKQGDVHVGKAVVHLNGTFDNSGEKPSVAMKLNGAGMPAADLASVLPAVGVTLPAGASLTEGTMDVTLTINGPVDKLVTTGPVKLSNAKLSGFDLGAKMGALSSLAGVPKGSDTVIQTFSSNVRIAPEGIRTDNLTIDVPAIGSIAGSGTIASNQALDYKMSARLSSSSSPMGKVTSLASLGGNQKGSAGGVLFQNSGHHFEAGVHTGRERHGQRPCERRGRHGAGRRTGHSESWKAAWWALWQKEITSKRREWGPRSRRKRGLGSLYGDRKTGVAASEAFHDRARKAPGLQRKALGTLGYSKPENQYINGLFRPQGAWRFWCGATRQGRTNAAAVELLLPHRFRFEGTG